MLNRLAIIHLCCVSRFTNNTVFIVFPFPLQFIHHLVGFLLLVFSLFELPTIQHTNKTNNNKNKIKTKIVATVSICSELFCSVRSPIIFFFVLCFVCWVYNLIVRIGEQILYLSKTHDLFCFSFPFRVSLLIIFEWQLNENKNIAQTLFDWNYFIASEILIIVFILLLKILVHQLVRPCPENPKSHVP